MNRIAADLMSRSMSQTMTAGTIVFSYVCEIELSIASSISSTSVSKSLSACSSVCIFVLQFRRFLIDSHARYRARSLKNNVIFKTVIILRAAAHTNTLHSDLLATNTLSHCYRVVGLTPSAGYHSPLSVVPTKSVTSHRLTGRRGTRDRTRSGSPDRTRAPDEALLRPRQRCLTDCKRQTSTGHPPDWE